MVEFNGGNDVDEDTIKAKLTWKEALTAAFTLQKYIADINEPFSHKLEGILSNFRCQTQPEEIYTMETSYITDYFTHN